MEPGIPPVLLYAVGAVAVYVLLHALDKGWKSQKKRRMQQTMCDDTPNIFVMMYAYKDNYAAASTIRHMLLHALCPSSISFGIVQSVTESSKDVYGLYKEASAYDPYVSKNIRVKTFYPGSHPSTLEAFDIALSQLYGNEEYVLITSPGTIFAAQFDIELVKGHRSISKHNNNKVVLTSHGKKFTMGKRKPSVTPSILSYMAAMFPSEQVEVDRTTWFPCYQSYEHVPAIYPRAAPNIQTKPMPVIACSVICSFFKGPPTFQYGPEDAWDASFFLSSSLYQQNYHFYAPAGTVAFPRTASSKYMVQRNIGSGSYGTYCNYAGVDQTTYQCYSRARLGLGQNFSTTEVKRKYGSDENYQVARTTL